MLLIVDNCTDPYRNLAAEEYLTRHLEEPAIRIWRNSDSVIVGRNQNARAEIDCDFVKTHGISVVRRLTGGGAVFHDLGNVNYSLYGCPKGEGVRRVIEVLKKLGLDASTSGRNDILLGGGKISGTAECISGGHYLQHGTLLFSASIESLAGALNPRPEKFDGKAVKSVRSRVSNISDALEGDMTVEEFMGFIADNICPGAVPYDYSEADKAATDRLLKDKYSTDGWNFGAGPRYSYTAYRKFPSGFLELNMEVSGGKISGLEIFGDYFFTRPTEEFCSKLLGCPADRDKIYDRLKNEPVGEYFSGITAEDIISYF